MRVVRIIETPAFARLTDRWRGLSQREQWLVGTAGVLLAFAILIFGVVQPLQASRAQSLADIRTYDTLMARVRAAGTLGAPSVPQRPGPAVSIVTQSAAQYSVTVQAEAVPGGARATVADAPYDAVVNWLADIARTSALVATRVEIRRTATPGRVAVTAEFQG